jgi:hypothetical protein
MAMAIPFGTFFFCIQLMGWAQIIPINMAISNGLIKDALNIIPAIMIIKDAKSKAAGICF